MPQVCFYFQVHQPHRLRRYSVFESSSDYFDHAQNAQQLQKIAAKCYLPATELLLRLIDRHGGAFKVAFSLTGTAVEQFQQHTPEVLEQFQRLAQTGCVEFLAETYHHSLAYLYSHEEFDAQIHAHESMIEELFGQRPTVFRNTELIYSNALAKYIAKQDRYAGMLVEGVEGMLAGRHPGAVFQPPDLPELPLLLKNHTLSDDIAFRFSDKSSPDHPLTPEKFAVKVEAIDQDPRPPAAAQRVCNLFMDFETFGEHQWRETGIFDFLEALPAVLLDRGIGFATPTEAFDEIEPVDVYDVPHMTSWADSERDLSAWIGNAMQSSALQELYKLEPIVKELGDAELMAQWQQLTTSDHFYYMCTKYQGDAEVHEYFNPYQSPYDGYINFMNVMDNLRVRLEILTEEGGEVSS